jgi:RNA polymerase sigma-70 factor, ECF subfamily
MGRGLPLRLRKPRIPLSPGHLIAVPEPGGEAQRVASLRAGDQIAFEHLVNQHTPVMLRVARQYVASHEIAEDVVQETWLAVYRGMSGFEGRSSLRTWIFVIMVNTAKTRGVRERRDRDVTIAAYHGGVGWVHLADDERPTRSGAVTPYPQTPEGAILAGELLAVIRREIAALPDLQRAVITLRAVLDVGSREVCDRLGLSTVHQRVLLHHGRRGVRRGLRDYVTGAR